ncbi:GNAT family N-acetyltransferase [Flavobacterium sp.]|uniref:GNAT family N-acetyltransferase n=1 Tax=Flavobacterium sp. TaxID=239 RepID=UPI00260A72DB|nr:GNAT family N-acetyltransferase [Flavobacterium sp.]
MTTFKQLALSDIENIVLMMRDFYAIDNYPMDIEVSKTLFTEFINDENLGRAWLIYEEKEIIGYVILTFIFSFEYKGKIAFLDELYLSEKTRGKGIGKKAMDFIQAQAKDLKLKVIYLEIENHNENAQNLYLKSNFIVHNRKLMKYSTD